MVSANDKITLGFIGVYRRGMDLIGEFLEQPDVEIGAVCDIYDKHLDAGIEKAGGNAKRYKDFRKLLEQKDIDAVVIASPPHWHPLMSIYACQAGKDVYCEKPISLFVNEARAMAKTARDTKRVTQVGTQIHSVDNFRRVVEIVRSGILGKITSARTYFNTNEYPGGIGRHENGTPPEGLDWDMWLGPQAEEPYNPGVFESLRYFKRYIGSWLNELGPHIMDLPFWAMDTGEPLAVSASGGRFTADDMSDIPDTMDVIWEYPDFQMTWMNNTGNGFNFGFSNPPDKGRRHGTIFQGAKGTLLANYFEHTIVPEGDSLLGVPLPEPSIPSSPGQVREFLDAIKTRQQPLCNFDYHLPIAVAINLAHVSLEVGRKLHWDAEKGEVAGDSEANALLTPVYRKPWVLPEI